MIIIGLTGSIGMGKSAAASILRDRGLPVYEADKAVHALLRKGGKGVISVRRSFPEAFRKGAIDRKQLGRMVFGQPKKLKRLEKILHPLVRQMEKDFLRKARARRAAAVILEIPLLFETGGEKRCDFVICVTAPKKTQHARVLQRAGMTKAKLKAIHARQMSDRDKRTRADFVVDTGGTKAETKKQLQSVLKTILGYNHA